jgi:hypothetical protein
LPITVLNSGHLVARHPTVCYFVCYMQNIIRDTVIETKFNPKDFRVKYGTITVRDGGEFETTATTEIFHEDYDPATGIFTIGIALHYPSRTSGIKISIAKPARGNGGKVIGLPPDCYVLTQADFEAVMRREVINVPACY